MNPKLSIIISNRNDTSMLSVTIHSCIEELRPLGPGVGEIVIADNSEPTYRQKLKTIIPPGYLRDKTIRMYNQDFPCLFSARELAAKQALGTYILCLDSHMIVGRDALLDLVNFMDRHSDDPTMGFAHAPISWAHQHGRNAKHDRDMSKHELGDWGLIHKTERTITWKGMPWICRRDWFLDQDKGLNAYGALSAHKVSWGGGDMHIGIKPWLLGFKNWAVPTNPCVHIGPFPKIDTTSNPSETINSGDDYRYRVYSNSGNFPATIGFLISCYILGGEPMMNRNKEAIANRFGKFLNPTKWWTKAIELGQEEKAWLDARKVMTFEQFLTNKPWLQ